MEFLILLALILLNGLFAMTEMSIVTSRRARLQQQIQAGSKGAAVALRLADDPGRFLSTVQVGITTIGILSGAFGENAIAEVLIVQFNSHPLIAPYSHLAATAIMVLVVTYCSVVLGEIVPKRLALRNPERMASFLAPPMNLLAGLAYPLVALFSLSSNALLRLLGNKSDHAPPVTEEEIRVMLQQGAAAGVFKKSEETMVGNVFRLDDLRVAAIMTPRLDIRYLDVEYGDDANQQILIEGRFQKLPVCRGGLDHILGLLDAKDYLSRVLRNERPRLEDAVHPAIYVPETISTIQLLETMRRHACSAALVVDEYGSVEGMVTLSDVLEAIIGDLPGAEPIGSTEAIQREDGSWSFDGMISLDRASQVLELTRSLDSDEHDYHTLGGLVMDRLGKVPMIGDCFDIAGMRFEVLDMDGNRVDRVLVTMPNAMPLEATRE